MVAKKQAKNPIRKITKKKPAKSNYRINADGRRVRKIVGHSSFKLTKKSEIKKVKPLPPIKQLLKSTNQIFRPNKKLFLKLTLLLAFLNFLFVKGVGSGFNLVATKNDLIDYFGGTGRDFDTTIALFGQLLTAGGGGLNDLSGAYQFFFTLITVLATLWIIRRLVNKEKATVKDAYYNGMYPLIPFLLVGIVVVLQLIPAAIGSFLLSTVLGNGLAVTAIEQAFWIIIYITLNLLSLYMVLSSIFAMVIVTLNNVTPMIALRSARELVLHRRLKVLARLVILFLIVLIAYSLIFLPLIIYLPAVAEPVFLIVSSFLLIYTVAYFYNLYRQLL